MRRFLVFLLLAGLCMAFSVTPDYLGIKDSGDERLPKMNVSITIDCDSKTLTIEATDEEEQPIEDAKTYLFYTDYGYQALPNPGTTDADGISVMDVPGNIRFLTAMFILRVDHGDFQTKEIEFAYERCFEPPPAPPPEEPEGEVPPAEPEEAVENVTEQPNVTENVTPSQPPEEETTTPPPEGPAEEAEAPLCPLGLLLLTPLVFSRLT
jgi:hypothetical protein